MRAWVPIVLLLLAASAAAGDPGPGLAGLTRRIPLPTSVRHPDRPVVATVTRLRTGDLLLLLLPGSPSDAVRRELEAEAARLGFCGQVVDRGTGDLGPIVTAEEWPRTPEARTDPWFFRQVMDALLEDLRPEIERTDVERERGHLAGRGSVETRDGISVLSIRGGPHAMGLQHGTLLRERIRALLAQLGAREGVGDEVRKARALLPAVPPGLRNEIRGIAEGACIAFEDALFLSTAGGLSTTARASCGVLDARMSGPREALLGRYAVATLVRPARGYPVVTIGWAGSAGAVAAISARGIALAADHAASGPSPLGLRLRHAAQYARSPGDAAVALKDLVGSTTVKILWKSRGDPAPGPPRIPRRGRERFPGITLAPRRGWVIVHPDRGRAVAVGLDEVSEAPPISPPFPYDVPIDPTVRSLRFEPRRSFANGCRVLSLTFRSPVDSGDARNDLVPADLYEPSFGPVRGAVVLMPIWRGGGPFLERYVAAHLVRRGFATLILPLPYQFGRGPPDRRSGALTITGDLERNRRVMRQAVSEARWARLWLRDRGYREDRIAVMGISLGGHVAALAYGVDPGFARGAFVLTGGDLAGLLWNDSRDTRSIKRRLLKKGVTLADVRDACHAFEPLRFARPWRGATVVMAAALRDATVPPGNVKALRMALGGPPVLWVDATHTSGLVRLPGILRWIADGLTRFSVQAPPSGSR